MKKIVSYIIACLIVAIVVFILLYYVFGMSIGNVVYYIFLVIVCSLAGEFLGPRISNWLTKKRS